MVMVDPMSNEQDAEPPTLPGATWGPVRMGLGAEMRWCGIGVEGPVALAEDGGFGSGRWWPTEGQASATIWRAAFLGERARAERALAVATAAIAEGRAADERAERLGVIALAAIEAWRCVDSHDQDDAARIRLLERLSELGVG